ncbi:hypothetical protein UA08_02647 [Talaromyces atroroseus]|uniref:CRIB domain-containing protein n=1 Tax=Talaromyces atroroseus TaxID=1441469 RepID=A0A225B1U3_TALAT|nr:hypothetical protein UA08_02647 [Talaromyces atroroseus]OKL61939.1 hypothetical protein UA08_02647 [Talaromyces atroroseus]
MAGHSRTLSPESWQDDADFSQRPPTSSTSEYSDHSFHSRSKSSAHVSSPKRLSMFSRSRSNTTTITSASARQLPAVPLTYGEPSILSAVNDEKPSDNVARSLLVRGSRILRRQGSKLNVAAALEEEDEVGKKFEVSNIFHRVPKLKKNDSQDQLKRIISEPYNFHHLTHTSSSQFQTLDNGSNVELVDEFSAIQASQMPEPGLKGIRAQNLLNSDHSFTERSNESVSDFEGREPTSPLAMSPPVSPNQPRSPGRIENFSRPVSRLNKPLPPSPSILPSPRASSRQAHSDIPEPTSQAIDELLGVNYRPTIADYEYPQLENHSFHKVSSLEQIDLAGMLQSKIEHGIAIGQLDGNGDIHGISDDAKVTTALINSYLSDLEDVPEEDETKDAAYPVSRISRTFSVRAEDKKLAVSPSKNSGGPNRGSVIVVEDSQLSFQEDIMSPTLPQSQPIMHDLPTSQASNTRRRSSAGLVNFTMAWDEDIDYCYEHEAEADCNFDWNRPSLDTTRQSIPGIVTSSAVTSDSTKLSPHYLQVNATSIPATPDLDPGSAQSILTRSHEALTPLSDGTAQVAFFVSDHEYLKDLQANDAENDTAYENFLAVGEDPDGQFQFFTQTTHPIDVTTSPRSSGSAISKCNSQESVILSRAASIVRKHRSSTSTTSVPELINSSNSSRENTIRESVDSLEHPAFSPLPDTARPGFSVHRPVKSLGSDLSTLSKLRTTGSNGSIHVVDLPYHLASATHDRTKSTSAIDHDETHKLQQSTQGLPFAARQSLAAQRRKSRAGYSLFPTVQ